jgi:hypothetical protein
MLTLSKAENNPSDFNAPAFEFFKIETFHKFLKIFYFLLLLLNFVFVIWQLVAFEVPLFMKAYLLYFPPKIQQSPSSTQQAMFIFSFLQGSVKGSIFQGF